MKDNRMKHEWRKDEKEIYLPHSRPSCMVIPAFKFLTISGNGNPNSSFFGEYISALYMVSYAIKMNLKKGNDISGYNDYTVYPLEGVWDIREEARKDFNGKINKDDLVFTLMIRQPDFVPGTYVEEMIVQTKEKKHLPLLDQLKFETIDEGLCVQMLHKGSFDDEPESFAKMEAFISGNGLTRISKRHREVYLSDFRKVEPSKLKTVLRFKAERL